MLLLVCIAIFDLRIYNEIRNYDIVKLAYKIYNLIMFYIKMFTDAF